MTDFTVASRDQSLDRYGRVKYSRGQFVGGGGRPFWGTAKRRKKANLAMITEFKAGLRRDQQRLGKTYSNIADLAVDVDIDNVKRDARGQRLGDRGGVAEQAENVSGLAFELLKQRFRNYSSILDHIEGDLIENYNKRNKERKERKESKENKLTHPLPDEVLAQIVRNIDVKALAERARFVPPELTSDKSLEEKKSLERDHLRNLQALVQAHAEAIADGISEAYQAHMQDQPLEMRLPNGQMKQIPQSRYLAQRTLKNLKIKAVARHLTGAGNMSLAIDKAAVGDAIKRSFETCLLEQQSKLKRENFTFIKTAFGIDSVETKRVKSALADELQTRKAHLSLAGAKLKGQAGFPVRAMNYTPTAPIERKLKAQIGIGDGASDGTWPAPTVEDYTPGEGVFAKDWDRLPFNEADEWHLGDEKKWDDRLEEWKNEVKGAVDHEIALWKTHNEELKDKNPDLYDYIDMRSKAWFGKDYNPNQDPSLRTVDVAAAAARQEIPALASDRELQGMFLAMHECRRELAQIERNWAEMDVNTASAEEFKATMGCFQALIDRCEAKADFGFKELGVYRQIEAGEGDTTIKKKLTAVTQDLSDAYKKLQKDIEAHRGRISQSYVKTNLEPFQVSSDELDKKHIIVMSAEKAEEELSGMREVLSSLKSFVEGLDTGGQTDDPKEGGLGQAKLLIKKVQEQIELLQKQVESRRKTEALEAERLAQAEKERLAAAAEKESLAPADKERLAQADKERLAAADKESLAAVAVESRLQALAAAQRREDDEQGKYGVINFKEDDCDSAYLREKFSGTSVQNWRTAARLADAINRAEQARKYTDTMNRIDMDSFDWEGFLFAYHSMAMQLEEWRQTSKTLEELRLEVIEAARLVYDYRGGRDGAAAHSKIKDARAALAETVLGDSAIPIDWTPEIPGALDKAKLSFGDLERFIWEYKASLELSKSTLEDKMEQYSGRYEFLRGYRLFPNLYKLKGVWGSEFTQKNKAKNDPSIEDVMQALEGDPKDHRWAGPLDAIDHILEQVEGISSKQYNRTREKVGRFRKRTVHPDVKGAMKSAIKALVQAADVRQQLINGEVVDAGKRQDAYDEVVSQLTKYGDMPKPKKNGGIYGELYDAVRQDLELAKAELKKQLL